MKNIFKILFLLAIFCLVYVYKTNITDYIIDNFIEKKQPYNSKSNEYSLNYEFNYVKITDIFSAKNQNDILNIFYTYLNNGEDYFYFYCDYENCEGDIKKLIKSDTLNNINNFIHPFNTYNKIYVDINPWGKITVEIDKSYGYDEIQLLNEEINKISNKIIKKNMTDKEKIETFHNYIINNTKYDIEYVNSNIQDINNPSHKATGTLIHKKSLCGGYAQTMSLFLNKLKIPNYRISSDTHIWNLVKLDNNWYHIDLTWDDPITSDKSDVLLDKYLFISTKELENLNTGHHKFDKLIYKEAN